MIDEYVKKWLQKANEDYLAAKHELSFPQENEIITSTVCFHCQQAVEKYLKAYLTDKKIEFGKTHSLEFLLELCIKIDKEFENIDVGDLSFYAVDVRYPDDFYQPSLEEAKKAFIIADNVRSFILEKIK